MLPRNPHGLVSIGLLMHAVACTDDVVLPPVNKKIGTEWSKALQDISTPSGIHVERLKEHQDTLEAYLGWASVHGPHTNSWGESKEDRRIGFLLNVHNAAVLHNLLRNDFPNSPDRITTGPFQWPGSGFYWGTRYKVDKEWTSLKHLAVHDTVNRYAEPLLWMALFDGTKDSPILRWWPKKKGKLQPRLERAAKRFVNSDRGMSKTADGWAINPLFLTHEKDFLDWTDSINLCEWMTRYAKGERKRWLNQQKENCTLTPKPSNRATDIATAPSKTNRQKATHGAGG